MSELAHIKAFIHGGFNKRLISTGIAIYILENGKASTRELSEFFDLSVESIGYALTKMVANGWIECQGRALTNDVRLNDGGELVGVARNNGVYVGSEKLESIIN